MESSWLETRWARPFYLAFVFCLALGLLQAIKLYLRRQRLLRGLSAFPGPAAGWFNGLRKVYPKEGFEELEKLVEKHPCAFPVWAGPFQPLVIIYDPDYVKTFLNRTDPKSNYLYKFLTPYLGNGLLNLNGPKWYQHRRLITPVFSINILKSYFKVMVHSVNIMLDKWENICSTQDTVMEVFEHIQLLSMDILLKCTFSRETNCQLNSTQNHYVNTISEISKIIFNRMGNVLLHPDIIFKFSPDGRRLPELSKSLHRYTEQIIQERKKSFEAEKKQGNGQKKFQDFLDIVISAQHLETIIKIYGSSGEHRRMDYRDKDGDSFSDDDIWSEVNTFMIAGQDTVAGSLCWVLYHLAQHPEHQERCREEIRGIVEDGSSIIWDQLGEMSYTTMCIKESLRLIPTVFSISRELSKPITFPDGRSLPAGVTVVLSIWGLHHNPAVWENPKVFDPLRFSQENHNQRHTHSFLPFSAGPRNCIGQQFAMMVLKVATALILLRFQLTLDPTNPLSVVRYVLLKPKNGFHLYLKKLS